MSNPDRSFADQEPRPSETPAERSTSSSTHATEASGPTAGEPPISRARLRPPRLPKPPQPAFVSTGGTEQQRLTTPSPNESPRIDADHGLGWLGATGASQDANRRMVRPPRKAEPKIQADLHGQQSVRGRHIGDRYVRIVRQQSDSFEREGPGHLIATSEATAARGGVSRVFSRVKRTVIGAPLSSAEAGHQRLTKLKALAVLSSDALSSVAYATEEILRVLLLAAGLSVLHVSLPVGAAIVALLVIVGISYRQTIKAYPHGGGSYIVAKDNLGEVPALTAGAALLTDYILTVAVSIAAAVAALISAFPEFHEHRVLIGLGFILLVTLLNLRGIRESGSIFAVPTYLFLVGIVALIAIGFVRNALDGFAVHQPPVQAGELAGTGALTLFVVLKAFSSGCAALTGVEAISDGVPAFQPPEWKNARTTLTFMIGILAVTFTGITFLAHQYGTYPMEASSSTYETVVSQIARQVFGGTNVAYYYIQFATLAILVLAANTAYSDFPRLAYFLARDRFMPRQFTFRGDRLAFSTGIISLGLMSGLVLVRYQGEVEHLIPLYALGVFTSFTISQFGMFIRWTKRREPGWQLGRVINLVGAAATAVVAVIVAITKAPQGAWIVMILIPLLILAMRGIHKHYTQAATELATSTPLKYEDIKHTVIVPIAAVNRIALQTLAYARSISENVTAVHITDDDEEIEQMRKDWNALGSDLQLVIIESPYRALVNPLLKYIDEVDKQRPDDTLTIVLPEYIARHWWEHLLHNQTALRLKAALLFRPGTVVISVPYHLERPNKSS